MKYILIVLVSVLTFATSKIYSQSDSENMESEIILKTPTGDISGTLTMPTTKKKQAVVLIISGSGPTDRDGNNKFAQNNSLKYLAETLAKNKIASVRFDKRGIGQSQGAAKEEKDLRFEDYVNDVEAWVKMLAEDPRFGKISIVGHSEGSLIGMIAAANTKTAAFVSLAGAGRPASEVLKEQLATIPESMQAGAFGVIDSLKQGFEVNSYDKRLFSLFRPSVQPYLISWMKYDPSVEIAKLKIPVMIVQGGKDLQVDKKDAEMLFQAKPDAKYLLIDNMNHVLKPILGDKAENFESYKDPKIEIDQKLGKDLSKFIKKFAK